MITYEADTPRTETTDTAANPRPAEAGAQAATVVPPPVEPAVPAPLVLLVDDEPGVLSALRRLLRPTGYRVLTAESGAAGLELLAAHPVDLIISDMRMPNMNGAEFLSRARAQSPDTMRILLTGYAEIDAAVCAINEGGVYRYLNKPWDDQDLLLTVRRAIEQRTLAREAARLTELTRQQNHRLQALNAGLESQVEARTEEIRQTVLFLEDAQHDLKSNFTKMARVCANMIELRCGIAGGQSMRVGDLARRIALACGLTGLQSQDIFHAALLHGIGKLSLPDGLLRKSLDRLAPEEMQLYLQHPLRAQMVLTPVPQLQAVAHIIRHQYERYNGRGTPDRLVGEHIPIGARIVALARDYMGLLARRDRQAAGAARAGPGDGQGTIGAALRPAGGRALAHRAQGDGGRAGRAPDRFRRTARRHAPGGRPADTPRRAADHARQHGQRAPGRADPALRDARRCAVRHHDPRRHVGAGGPAAGVTRHPRVSSWPECRETPVPARARAPNTPARSARPGAPSCSGRSR